MTKRQHRQLEMLVRVRDFGTSHQEAFPEGGEGSKAFAAVAATLAEISAFTVDLRTASRQARQAKLQAKRGLSRQITAIARSARVMAKTTIDFDAPFPPPTGRSDFVVRQIGRLYVDKAAAVKEVFVRCGLAPSFLEELQHAVTAFEEAIAGKHRGRTNAVVSRIAVRSALRVGMNAVNSLDVFVANVLGRDVKMMAEWKSTRRVERVIRETVATPDPQPANPPAASPLAAA